MKTPIKISKQPHWQKGLFLFISALIVFKAGNCFSNDDIAFDSSYKHTRLLYEDEEEARRVQLKQLQLKNDILTRRVKIDYEKQQLETKNKRHQNNLLTKTSKTLSVEVTPKVVVTPPKKYILPIPQRP